MYQNYLWGKRTNSSRRSTNTAVPRQQIMWRRRSGEEWTDYLHEQGKLTSFSWRYLIRGNNSILTIQIIALDKANKTLPLQEKTKDIYIALLYFMEIRLLFSNWDWGERETVSLDDYISKRWLPSLWERRSWVFPKDSGKRLCDLPLKQAERKNLQLQVF